jgi:hypothetical protein
MKPGLRLALGGNISSQFLVRSSQLLGTIAVVLLFGQCAQNLPPVPPSLELPRPVSDLRAVRKADKVYLRWTMPQMTSDGQTIRSLGKTRICRTTAPEMKDCVPVGETAENRKEQSYIDNLPPDVLGPQVLTYAVEVPNADQRSAGLSNRVQISAVNTLPPPQDFTAQATADGIVLKWAAVQREREFGVGYLYRIYRRQEGSKDDSIAGEVPLGGPSTLLDHGFEWEKTYFYRATVVTQTRLRGFQACPEGSPPRADCATEVSIEGEDTPTIRVFADDVFPPAVPAGLQAVFSGVGQAPFIDLIWSPGTENDLAGYNIYRRERDGRQVKLNQEPVKLPAYRDSSVQPGKEYIYTVSAVDLRGNESPHSGEASERVP